MMNFDGFRLTDSSVMISDMNIICAIVQKHEI
jgi:hypothetical protein